MAALKTRIYDVGPVRALEISGSITMGEGDLTVRHLIKGILAEGHTKIVVDLSNVPSMDSTGLGELVSAYTSAKHGGAVLKLAGLTRKVKDILTITRLTSVFESYDTVDEAAKSF
jgi:anti-sigma B factor antagonist